MELKAVACGNCGAPLQVPDAVRFLNCNHCASSLEIKHTESVTYSEQIAQIDERTERIEQKLEVLELQSELARLDSAWQVTREKLMVTNKRGHKSIPSKVGAVIGGVIAVLFGILFTSVASQSPVGLGGLVFIALGLFGAATGYSKANAYELAEWEYQDNRRQIQDRLSSARGEQPALPWTNS